MSNNVLELAALSLQPRDQPKVGGKISLQYIFNAIVDYSKVEIHKNDIQSILKDDLDIKTNLLTQQVANVLIDAVFYYVKSWDGWKRWNDYLSGTLTRTEWFQCLRKYLCFKCNQIIENADEYNNKCETKSADVGTQTDRQEDDVQVSIKECPYKLVIEGSPALLNNIAFLIRDENLFIKQHSPLPFPQLSIIELLNWPHVSVELKLPDVHFERTNTHKFFRYITCESKILSMPEDVRPSDDTHITHITETSGGRKPYTVQFIWKYFVQLIGCIKKHLSLKVSAHRIQEIEAVCHQLVQDIKEMNIAKGSMCTNTTVGFRIGFAKYSRQKQMVTSDKDKAQTSPNKKNIVELLEIMLPQMDCTLNYFKAEQDLNNNSTEITYKSLNSLFRNVMDLNNQNLANFVDYINTKCLIYNCTFCNEKFTDSAAATKLALHFSEHHKLGHPLLCKLCGKLFEIKILAGKRWKHDCI